MQPGTPAPSSPPEPSRSLPVWVWVLIGLGGLLFLAGIASVIIPLLILLVLVGNGEQHPTQALVSADSLALFHMNGDLDDPGTEAMVDRLILAYPQLLVEMRRAQGAPMFLAELESWRNMRNLQSTAPSFLPRQLTVTMEPGAEGREPALLVAANLQHWGRAVRLGMHSLVWIARKSAEGRPGAHVPRQLVVEGHPFWVSQEHGGHSAAFWGMVDGTIVGGGGDHAALRPAVQRIDADEELVSEGELAQVLALLGPGEWEAFGGLLYQPPVVEQVWAEPSEPQVDPVSAGEIAQLIHEGGGEMPELEGPAPTVESSCLAELDPAAQRGLAVSLDIASSDELRGVLVLLSSTPEGVPSARECARETCAGWREQLAEPGLALSCEHVLEGLGVVTHYSVTGLDAALDRWIERFAVELEKERAAQQAAPPPFVLDDLEDWEEFQDREEF